MRNQIRRDLHLTRSAWLVATTIGILLFTSVPRAQIVQTRAGQPRTGELDIACGPRAVFNLPVPNLMVLGSQEGTAQLIAPYHGVVVSGGSNHGLKVGQEYYVRRVIPPMDRGKWTQGDAINIHTAGWVKIVQVESGSSVADAVFACDGFEIGDFLEPYTPAPAEPKPIAGGQPDFENPGAVLFGDEHRTMAAGTSLMVIDRGSDHGLKPGQQVTVFRRSLGGIGPIHSVARGLAISVAAESAMVRLDRARDAVYAGDLVAMHR